MQQQHNLEHLDLDLLAWSDSREPARKPLAESINEIDDYLSNTNGWVIEGCYADLLEHVIEVANEIVFLNPGKETCIQHCCDRPWESHKYASKQEQDNNLNMLIDWVRQYDSRDDEFSLAAHKSLFNAYVGKKTEILKGQSYPL